jgi:hypothetical protein
MMQSVLNNAAISIICLRRYDHVTPALVYLHWLRVPKRMHFKVATLVYLLLHRLAPQYLATALHRTVDINSRHLLQPANSELLMVPHSWLILLWVTIRFRPQGCGSGTVCSTQSLACFKHQLKTFLFSLLFLNYFFFQQS